MLCKSSGEMFLCMKKVIISKSFSLGGGKVIACFSWRFLLCRNCQVLLTRAGDAR